MSKTLKMLLSEIEKQIVENQLKLEYWRNLKEVNCFLMRRQMDFNRFKRLTLRWGLSTEVSWIQQRLREELPDSDSKFFGGICIKGKDYFKITQKVKDEIDLELSRMENERREKDDLNTTIESKSYFDPDYAIFDELSSNDIESSCD